VRWPGGCFADEYHWREGIGPRNLRPIKVNTNWGGVIEDNSFGTHEFMGLVERLGAEAYVSANVGNAPPRELAEWVEYLTSPTGSTLARERAANGHPAPFALASAMNYGAAAAICAPSTPPTSPTAMPPSPSPARAAR